MALFKNEFGENFNWGVSTAAYQIEGAYNTHGKGPSIWDVFSNTKGKIHLDQNANTTCNFYNKYAEDIILMNALNITNYRFSISWSRVFPKGTGAVNYAGVAFYNRLIDFCLELNIQPWITLYHWDLPYELEKKGGWNNREVINWFAEYVSFCVKKFGDRVKHWMILNEPMVFTGAGYFLGIHAPGKKGMSNFLSASHHATLCQAEGARIIKSFYPDAKVGTTFSCSHIHPNTESEVDVSAAIKVDALLNRMFIEPLLGLGYPLKELKILQRIEKYIRPNDEAKLKFDMDFIGIQNYTREIVSHSYFMPFINAKIIKADKRNVETTTMNWEVYPESIYAMLKKVSAYKNVKEIIITENGAAFPDKEVNGVVNDAARINYLQNYLSEVLRAKKEGVKVNGYFVWSFMDNFEWAEGYKPRFGLVYIDFKTQKRIVKSSGYWYRDFLQQNNSATIKDDKKERIVSEIFY
jgi:beta-glucosidase